MTELESKPRVFLSYAARDESVARGASQLLQDAGCDVFSPFSPGHMDAGDDLFANVQDALKDTDALVLIASPDAVTSQWMAFELGAAMAWGKPVYVVASGGLPLPVYLQQTRVVRAGELPDLARALRREAEPLTDAERKILSSVYVDVGVPTDQLLMDPDAGARLVREYNQQSRSHANLNRLGRELLQLRKLGRLPRLGRTGRSAGKREPA